jgi:hypothetical protein
MGDLIADYLDGPALRKRASTLASERSIINRYILPTFKARKVAEVSPTERTLCARLFRGQFPAPPPAQ